MHLAGFVHGDQAPSRRRPDQGLAACRLGRGGARLILGRHGEAARDAAADPRRARSADIAAVHIGLVGVEVDHQPPAARRPRIGAGAIDRDMADQRDQPLVEIVDAVSRRARSRSVASRRHGRWRRSGGAAGRRRPRRCCWRRCRYSWRSRGPRSASCPAARSARRRSGRRDDPGRGPPCDRRRNRPARCCRAWGPALWLAAARSGAPETNASASSGKERRRIMASLCRFAASYASARGRRARPPSGRDRPASGPS